MTSVASPRDDAHADGDQPRKSHDLSAHKDQADKRITTASEKHSDEDRVELLGEVADRFTEELQAGQEPRLEDYLARYPEIAESIRRLFPSLAALHGQMPRESRPWPASLPVELGDYLLKEEIGRGGMGVVYRAEQRSLGRTVALKTLPWAATLSDTHLARFRNEARAAASLAHPHIVPVYSVGCDQGVNYYVMQLIAGRSVAEWLEDQRKPPDANTQGSAPSPSLGGAHRTTDHHARLVARLAAQAARALDHAHAFGVVHRDIKPGNLLVSFPEHASEVSEPKLWVTDFGLAQMEGDVRLSRTGDLLGTVRYMSPEQTKGRTSIVDHRTDIYSLGATIYEWLTGRPAFGSDDRMTLLHEIAEQDPTPLRRIMADLPRDLETIVAKAMEKSPADRYRTAGELADDLENFLHCRPLIAQPSSIWHRATKWARRHQAVVWTAGLVLSIATVLLAASTILVTIAYRGTDQQRQRAETHLRLARELIDNTYLKEARRIERDPAAISQQRDILERLIEFYRGLPAEDRGVPELRQDTAFVQQRLGDLYRSIGQHGKAEQAYRDAIQLLGPVSQKPEAREVQRLRILTLDGLGALLHELHRDEESIHAHEESSLAIQSARQQWSDDPEIQRLATRDLHLAIAQQETTSKEATLRRVIETLAALRSRFPHDEELMIAVAQAQDQLGEIFRTTGRHREAESTLRQALAAFQQVIDTQPSFRLAHFERAGCRIHLASLLAETSRVAEAEDSSRQAVGELTDMAATSSGYVPYRKDLARALAQHGRLLHELDKLEEASHEYQRSIDLYNELIGKTDDTPSLQAGLATCLSHLGRATLQRQRREEAKTHYEHSCALWQDLVQRYPHDPDYRRSLASARVNLTRFTNFDETVALCELAIAEMEKLSERYPERVLYAQDLIRFHSLSGHALQQLERLVDAERHFVKAIEIAGRFQLENPEVQRDDESMGEFITLGDVSSQLGKHRQAAEAHRLAVERCCKLLEQFPGKELYRSNLCSALKRLAIDEIGLGQIPEAMSHAQESLQIAELLVKDFPQQPQYAAKLDRRYTLLTRIHLFCDDLDAAHELAKRHTDFAETFRRQFPAYQRAVTPPAILHALKSAIAVANDPDDWSTIETDVMAVAERLKNENDGLDSLELQTFWTELLALTGRDAEAKESLANLQSSIVHCPADDLRSQRRLLACKIRALVITEWTQDGPLEENLRQAHWRAWEALTLPELPMDNEWCVRCLHSWLDLRHPTKDHMDAITRWLDGAGTPAMKSEMEPSGIRLAWAHRSKDESRAKEIAQRLRDGGPIRDVESQIYASMILGPEATSDEQEQQRSVARQILLAHPLDIPRLWRLEGSSSLPGRNRSVLDVNRRVR